ncbi:hypothetical protein D3C78_829260 [compost metagenome]
MTGFNYARQQNGAVLVVALIMLLLVTLMAVSGYKISQGNQMVIGNMEHRDQVISAATDGLEELLSSTLFVTNPSSMVLSPCGAANRRCYDINGDGVNDIEVSFAPPICQTVKPLRTSELDLPEQVSCVIQDSEYSMCAESVWELRATAVDNLTGARAEVRQGVALMVLLNDVDTACPN